MLPQINDIMNVTTPNFPNAVCIDVDPEVFFPDESSKGSHLKIAKAKEFCFTCSHRIECLEFAIKEKITDGVWGGLSSADRKANSAPRKYKTRTNLGIKSLELRNQGLKMREIAERLNSTPTAVAKAITRHIETIEVAS